jgi:hypothetical protein
MYSNKKKKNYTGINNTDFYNFFFIWMFYPDTDNDI